MLDTLRRIPLLMLVALLMFATFASAECRGCCGRKPLAASSGRAGRFVDTGDLWKLRGAYESKGKCDEVMMKQVEWMSQLQWTGRLASYDCFADTVDPRGTKRG